MPFPRPLCPPSPASLCTHNYWEGSSARLPIHLQCPRLDRAPEQASCVCVCVSVPAPVRLYTPSALSCLARTLSSAESPL
ncbi:hypothetical protein DAEQUDRAFT_721396 [Daedalea quercina L-15889]|uniref:Uncharacterized protein n=1 Tax=Daedalea quercina L-15889 TaxID=1314783 RepID=A0A165TT37_9APHY|nr:hypothetical protein DAEQUDRAFT_721396 [Daedalea quercina L-15889]